MKNFSEQEVRSDMLANYGCSVPVYFKILKCRKDFDRFPYFYISGKEYILWIYANPRHPEDTTNVAIPGVEGFKEIPKEIFGDFTKAKDAVIYALYKEDVIPQDYSGFKRVVCRNKADYRVVRDFGRGVTLIPAERLSKKYIFARARESFGKENLFTVVPRIFGIPEQKKAFWEVIWTVREKNGRKKTNRRYYDIVSGKFQETPFGIQITDRIPLDPHGPIVFVENICFKNDGENLSWSR